MTVGQGTFPFVAAGLTLLAALLAAQASAWSPGSLLTGLLPLVVPSVWGVSLVVAGSPGRHLFAAAAGLLAVSVFLGEELAVMFASYVAGGLGVGWAVARRWRHDAALGLGVLPLAIVVWWAVAQLPLAQLFATAEQDLAAALQETLPVAENGAAQEALRVEYERGLAATLGVIQKLWSGLLVLGLLSQVGIVMLLVRWLARWLAAGRTLRPLPHFHQWRFPFYLVWLLAGGVSLIVLRSGDFPTVGINLVVVAGTLLSIQGLAVQMNLAARVWPPWARVVFWAVAGIFFAPLVLASSLFLGLIDQWLDLRRRFVLPVP